MADGPLADLSPAEQRRLATLAKLPDEQLQRLQALVSGGIDRRRLLQAGGLAALGVAGAGSAAGAASTTDSDGDVGAPGDRVDVFSDGVDANEVSTGSQVINNREVFIQDSSPSSPEDGDFWVDTS